MRALLLALAALILPATAQAAPPPPSFTIDDATCVEGKPCSVVIRKHGRLNQIPSTVTFYTVDTTAKAPGDYTATRGTVAFTAAETRKTVLLPITNDTVVEPNEALTGKLTAGSNARLYDGTAVLTIIDDDVPPVQVPVPPAPPSPPDPMPPAEPAPSLAGEAEIADTFPTLNGVEPFDFGNGEAQGKLPGESIEESGAFRMRCNAGHLSNDDPIVYPGQPGASHLHQFWGNTGTNSRSTYESLRTTGGTTCGADNAPVNRTAYWMPAMLDGVGGVVKPDYINTYYKQVPSADCFKFAAKGCVGLPNGIRLVFGFDMPTGKGGPTDPESPMYWLRPYQCDVSDTDPTPTHPGRFRSLQEATDSGACKPGNVLNIFFGVPACWDGVNLDVPGHRSHLSAGTPETGGQVCPATHPYLITPWQGQVKFTVDANFNKWRLASDMEGMVRGSALHFDYWEAWSGPIKRRWQKTCIEAHKSCSSGDLGDGFWIKQTPVTPPHQVVPQPPVI